MAAESVFGERGFYQDHATRTPPARCSVIEGTTPVAAFGDVRRARVATLGINPSRAEFLDSGRELLRGGRRRLATLESLGIHDLATAPAEAIDRMLDECLTYFQRNPYRRWFDQLDVLLRGIDVSYYDGTACHLDLVPWATDPTWGGLDVRTRRALLDDGVPMLRKLLATTEIQLIVVNGRSVLRELENALSVQFDLHGRVEGPSTTSTDIVTGSIDGTAVVGWSVNLQSSFGVSREFRARLRDVFKEACDAPTELKD
ncbi:MAG TPA: hypothetical protein VGQ20_07240, partial [Acidimicrobiales bacterium]|nr:hypothetical protein [Acidimicrobiales bacterium]